MKIVVTGPAEADIEASLNFIRRDSHSAATSTAAALSSAVQSLATLPHRGRVGRAANTRELLVRRTSLILVYRVVSETVVVLRIRHASQAWPPRA